MKAHIFTPPDFDVKVVTTIARALEKADFDPTWVPEEADIIFSFGGDGCMLRGAPMAHRIGIPIFNWNQGHLGYLSATSKEITPESMDFVFNEVYNLLADDLLFTSTQCEYQKNERSVLTAGSDFSTCIINEFAILSNTPGKMIDVPLWVDEVMVADYQGDGLIISTATGSTAYNLSAGGSIIDPSCNVVAITPLNPFSIATRPIVASGQSHFMVEAHKDSVLVIDGHLRFGFGKDTVIEIVTAVSPLKLIMKRLDSVYSRIQKKLGWSTNIKG